MLIEKETLNIEEFKNFFNKMSWNKVPRKLGKNHKDFFYIGTYEDDNLIVKASIRPSLRMQIFETFKNRTLEGTIPPQDYKGRTCDWGGSLTIKVDENFLNKVKEISKELPPIKMQTLNW